MCPHPLHSFLVERREVVRNHEEGLRPHSPEGSSHCLGKYSGYDVQKKKRDSVRGWFVEYGLFQKWAQDLNLEEGAEVGQNEKCTKGGYAIWYKNLSAHSHKGFLSAGLQRDICVPQGSGCRGEGAG